MNVNKKTKLATLNPMLDGTYQIGLPAGDYSIDFDVAVGMLGVSAVA